MKKPKSVTKHGHTFKYLDDKGTYQVVQSKTYNSWRAAKQKCLCPNHVSYPNVGGKGVKVTDVWLDFRNFLRDMGKRPQGTMLFRLDNSKDFTKENCLWAKRDEIAQIREENLI